MLLTESACKAVWDRVYKLFHFYPSTDTKVIPFILPEPFVVYDIQTVSNIKSEQFDRLISNALLQCTVPGQRLYALDWQHSGFLYDPRDPEQRKSIYVEDARYVGGGYYGYFPDYYPDGDYYFFIDEQFCFGYLSHPWRKEVWIFGSQLISEFEKIETSLGWQKKSKL